MVFDRRILGHSGHLQLACRVTGFGMSRHYDRKEKKTSPPDLNKAANTRPERSEVGSQWRVTSIPKPWILSLLARAARRCVDQLAQAFVGVPLAPLRS